MTDVANEFSWTIEELHKWVEAGLVPKSLLKPKKNSELTDYLIKNKDVLLDKSPIGEAVKTLEMVASYDLCDGISLKVKAKELNEWEKETAEAKNLSKEQNETLKLALGKIGPDKTLTRKEISTLIEEIRKPHQKRKKYRQSGHLVDQKLKYSQYNQPSLFDLLPETKQKIEESHIEVKAEGIKLTYAENKLVHALNLLLYEKSQNSDSNSSTFYSGNAPSEVVPYGVPDQKGKSAVLKFKLAELCRAFIGSEEYSGADIKFIKSTLSQLESKKVLIKYDRVKKVREGKIIKTLTDRIEDFQSLIRVISFISDLSDKEKEALDEGDGSVRESRGELIVALNPIFTDQIDTKFIEFPEDTNRRLVIAAGGHNKVTASMNILMEYLLREASAKRYKPEINEEKLPYILGLEKYVEQNRKKRLQDRIEKDIQAIMNIGIIIGAEKLPNSTGGMKWVFHVNEDYD